MRSLVVPLVLLAFASVPCTAPGVLSAQGTPDGTWHTISDVDGKPRGIVELKVTDGVLAGTVVGTLRADETPGRVCDKCRGARKDQPLLGMEILGGLRWNGKSWTGGEVLDPDSGKTYRATVRLAADGRELTLRGYIGISLIGRSQRWVRAP